MKLVHRALVAVLALTGALPSAASAQVFLASKPHPDFAVGPLFVIANVRPDLTVTVNRQLAASRLRFDLSRAL